MGKQTKKSNIQIVGYDDITGNVKAKVPGQLKPLKPLSGSNNIVVVGYDKQDSTNYNTPIEGATPSEDYARGMVNPDRMNTAMAQNQGALDVFGNFVAQMGVEALAGTVEAASYYADWSQLVDHIAGQEQEYSNWLANYMKEAKNAVREATPIYVENEEEDGFQPGNGEWWAKHGGQGLGSTLSLLIPGLIVSKLGKIAGLGELGQNISAAFASRYAESTMEANSVYEDLIRQGIDPLKAGEAASKTWNANWAFALQDVFAFSQINKGFNAVSKGTKGTGFKSWLTTLGTQMVTEGTEEAGQYIVSEEAKQTALKANVDYFGEGFNKRLDDYIHDDEFKTSVLMGAMGGGVFHTAGSAISSLTDVKQGDLSQTYNKLKERLRTLTGRGIQQEVANATGDKPTSIKVKQLNLTQSFTDALNNDKLAQHKSTIEEQAKTADLDVETRQLYEQHIKDIDSLVEEQARLRNNPSIPQELHKPILIKQLEVAQNNYLFKQAETELTKELNSLEEQGLDPTLIPLKRIKTLAEGATLHAVFNPNYIPKAQEQQKAFKEQLALAKQQDPTVEAKLTTTKDEKLINLAEQYISTQEQKPRLQQELKTLATPEGIEAYKKSQADKKVNTESEAVLKNPNATREEILQAAANTTNPELKIELAKKHQELLDRDKQTNLDQIDQVLRPDEDSTEFTDEYDPDQDLNPDDLLYDPEADISTEIELPEETERKKKFGLTPKEVEEVTKQVDVETRKPKAKPQEGKEQKEKAQESTRVKTTASTISLNTNSKGQPIIYKSRYAKGKEARAEDIYAVDSATGQLFVNSPRLLIGQEVELRLEKDFEWDQRDNPTYNEDNYTVNVYVDGINRPITSLRSADNKYMYADERANNKALREQLAKQGSIRTTILDKNIGSIRVDNTLKSIEILQADYIQDQDGRWRMQKLPHNPILAYINHIGEVVSPNIGSMRGVGLNPGIIDKVEESISKYFTAADLKKMAGMTVTFRTAPDGTLRHVALDYRLLNDQEKGWVRNNLAGLMSEHNFDKIHEVIHTPVQTGGIYFNTDDKGRKKTPDLFAKTSSGSYVMNRHRFHISSSKLRTELLIPINATKEDGRPMWVSIKTDQLANFLSNKDFTYELIDYKKGEVVVSQAKNINPDKIRDVFSKLLDDQYKNVSVEHLNSEIQYTDPVTNQTHDGGYYDYLVKTESVQTKLKGSITVGTGEDSSYSYNQVSIYLDPNPSQVKIEVKEELITTLEDKEALKSSEDKTKVGIKEDEDLETKRRRLWEDDVHLKPVDPSEEALEKGKSILENLENLTKQGEEVLAGKPQAKDPHTHGSFKFKSITEEEFNWFKDTIGEEFLHVVKNVDGFIALNGRDAFGQYYRSLVTLGEYAPEGTAYHEAGHFMFDPRNGLITKAEREKILDEGSKIYNIKRSYDASNEPKLKTVDYKLRAVELLESDKAKEVFKKGEKNKWTIDKILQELAIPKEQKELLINLIPNIPTSKKSYEQNDQGEFDEYTTPTNFREELIKELAQQYTYVVEVNTSTARDIDDPSRDYWFQIGNMMYVKEEEIDGTNVEWFKDNVYGGQRVKITEQEFEDAKKEKVKQPEESTKYYSNLTVPGGTNYTENEIKTPDITPSIKGHAQFSTDQGIGWFRSDDKGIRDGIKSFGDKVLYNKVFDSYYFEVIPMEGKPSTRAYDTKEEAEKELKAFKSIHSNNKRTTRRILEVQSDLFQKGRDREDLITKQNISSEDIPALQGQADLEEYLTGYQHSLEVYEGKTREEATEIVNNRRKELLKKVPKNTISNSNSFLQLLNKDSNWVSFFIKSIIQDSASKGYEKVLFPTGNTASKVEGHETLEEFRSEKETRLAQLRHRLTEEALEKEYEKGKLFLERTIEGYNTTIETGGDLSTSTDHYISPGTVDSKYEFVRIRQNYYNKGFNNLNQSDTLTGDNYDGWILYEYTVGKGQKKTKLSVIEADKLLKDDNKYKIHLAEQGLEEEKNKLQQYIKDKPKFISTRIEATNHEIKQLEAELERVDREGFAALKPIYNFYETVVGNTLKKLYKDQIKRAKDEYGNEWYELTLNEEHKGQIKLKAIKEEKNSGDYDIEEEIMKEFERYKISNGKIKPSVAPAKGFFRRLLQMIKNLIGLRSPLEKLFNKFDQGISLEQRMRIKDRKDLVDFLTDPKYKLLPGFATAIQQKEVIQAFASEVMRLANEASKQEDIDVINFFSKKKNIDSIFNKIKDKFVQDFAELDKIQPRDSMTREQYKRHMSYLAMGIGKSIIKNEQELLGSYEDIIREGLNPIEGFKTRVLKELAKWGFKVRLDDNTIYETSAGQEEQDEIVEDKQDDEGERNYSVGFDQVNPSDSLSNRIRLFLSTIPEMRDGKPVFTVFGTPKPIDFKRVDSSLTLKLADAVNPLVRLELMAEVDPMMKAVHQALNSLKGVNTQLYNEFFVKYRRDTRVEKTGLEENKREFIPIAERGLSNRTHAIVNKIKFIDTDRSSSFRALVNKWRENGESLKLVDSSGGVDDGRFRGIYSDLIKLKDYYSKNRATISYERLKNDFENILQSIGITIPSQVWTEMDKTMKPDKKFERVSKWFFGEQSKSLEQVIKSAAQDSKNPYDTSTVLGDIAKKAAPYVEDLARGAYRTEDNKLKFSINLSSYITELFNKIDETKEDVLSLFSNDPRYISNKFLGLIRGNDPKLEVRFTSAYRKNEQDAKAFQDRSEIESIMLRLIEFHNNASDHAYINTGTTADKTNQPIVQVPKRPGLEFLRTVLEDNITYESYRIQALKQYAGVREALEGKVAAKEILTPEEQKLYKHIQENPLPNDVANLKDKARFIYIDALNSIPNLTEQILSGNIKDKEYLEAREKAKEVINNFIRDEYQLFLKFLEDNDIITTKTNKDGLLEFATNTRIPEGVLYNIKDVKQGNFDSFLKEFFYNDLAWRLEMSKVLQGDLALYKNQDDYYKRQYQLVTPGYKGYTEKTKKSTISRMVYAKQYKTNDNEYLLSLAKLIKPSVKDLNDPVVKEIIKYREVNKTDAQSLMTVHATRAFFDSLGQWSKEHEEIYQFAWKNNKTVVEAIGDNKLEGDEATTWRVKAAKVLMQPLKPFLFVDREIKLPNGQVIMIKEQIKDSVTMITPELAETSRGYKDLLDYMRVNHIDIASAEDTVKVGSYGVINLNNDSYKIEEFKGFWTREQVMKEVDKVFLFGDNTNDRVNTKYIPSSTQAVIRGLNNAIGIDTKKDRGTSPTSYFTNTDFEVFKKQVDQVIEQAKQSGKTIVIPVDGIGTGKAMLKERAPKLFDYLQQELNKLKTPNNVETWPNPAKWQVRITNIEDIRFPQFMPEKRKEEISGTQSNKLVIGNIDPKTKYNVDGQTLTGDKVIQEYNNLWFDKIKASSDALKTQLGVGEDMQLSDNPKKRADQLYKLWLTLKKALGDREISENYYDAIQLEKTLAGIDFTLPLSFPAFGPKFQSILSNLFKKKVINQKSPGYAAINLADWGVGYSDELKFITNKDGEVIEAEIGLPIDYIKDIELKPVAEYDPITGRIHWEKLNDNQKQALQFILYRIPTSNKSSMLPVKVVRITPPNLNNIIVIPGELTIQQGLDFDVDKSQLLRRVLDKEGKIDKKDVDTQLFNIYWAILTNTAHTAEMLTPLSTPTMEAKLTDLKSKGVIADIEKSSPYTTTSDSSTEIRNKDGQAEIGIASRFNTGHAVMQTILNYLGVNASIDIAYNNYKFNKLGRTEDADGVLISTNHGETQQAALDAAKVPLLAYFNVVKNTMAAFSTMIEFGVPLNVAIEFFMQPVIKEWTKFYKHTNNNRDNAREKLFSTYPAIKQHYDSVKNGDRGVINSNDLTTNLTTDVTSSAQHSARVFLEFENILTLADQLTNINNILSVDTLKDATSIEALQAFLENKNKAVDKKEKSIYIDERIFDINTTPPEGKRLAAFFKYGIQDAIDYIGQFYPSTSQAYTSTRDMYAKITAQEKITDKILLKKLNQFFDHFMLDGDASMSILMTKAHPLYNEDPKLDKSDYRPRWSFFDTDKNLFTMLLKMQAQTIEVGEGKDKVKRLKYPELQNNVLIKNLISEESRDNEVRILGIRNTDAQSDKTDYTNAWNNLLRSGDPAIKTLGHDLILYAVRTSGFNYSTKSFYELIPVNYWIQTGIADLWNKMSKNPSFDPSSALINFIRHNAKTLDKFPQLYGKWSGTAFISDSILDVKYQEEEYGAKHITQFTLKSTYKSEGPLPKFVRIEDYNLGDYRIYESNPSNPRVFKELQPLGGKMYTELRSTREPSSHAATRAVNVGTANPWKDFKSYNLLGTVGTESNTLLKKYLPEDTNTAEAVLNRLLANETDIEAKKGLEALIRNVAKINTPIELNNLENKLGVFEVKDTGEGVVSVIKINPNGNLESEAQARHVLLHELHHAYSVGVIQNPQGELEVNFVRNLSRMAEQLKMDKYEVIAELASNPEFRSKLKKTDLWSRILRAFRKLLGMRDTYDKVLDEYYTVLDQAADLQKYSTGEFALKVEEKKKAVKKQKPIEQMLSNLASRIKRLERLGKNVTAEELTKRYEKIKKLTEAEQMIEYVLLVDKEMEDIKKIYKGMSQDPSKVNPDALFALVEQLTSYKLLGSYNKEIARNPKKFEGIIGDIDSFSSTLAKLITDVSRMEETINKLVLLRNAYIVQQENSNPDETVEKIMDQLEVADRDITWFSRLFDVGREMRDTTLKTLYGMITRINSTAWRKTQEDLYNTVPKEVSTKIDIRTVDGYITKTLNFKKVSKFKALEEYEKWLGKASSFADKFAPIIDQKSLAENSNGVKFISPWSKRGYEIRAIKEGSKDYPLRQFYETFVCQYLADQQSIPFKALRPYLRIPTISKSLLETLLTKGVGNKFSLLGTAFLDNFRRRFDEQDYYAIDENGNKQDYIPTRFVARQDGIDGRLNTRQVSLDIATTLTIFSNEMYTRAGMESIVSDLELMKHTLGSRQVLKNTKRVDLPGIGGLLTAEREGNALLADEDLTPEYEKMSGKESEVYKAFETAMRQNVFGQFKKAEGEFKLGKHKYSVSKIVDSVLKYTGFNVMFGNFAIPITNNLVGKLTILKEAVGGNIISFDEAVAGEKLAWTEGFKAIQDFGRRDKVTKLGRIFTYFNPYKHESIQGLGTDTNYAKTIFDKILTTGGAISEFEIGVSTMGAVFERFSAEKDGKKINLYEALEVNKDGKPHLIDGYTYKGKKSISNEDIEELDQYILRTYQNIYGVSNKLDKAQANEHAIGRMVLFLRGWLIPGINTRWRTRDWDERLKMDSEGHYVSALIAFNNVFTKDTGYVSKMVDTLRILTFRATSDPKSLLHPTEMEFSDERKEQIIALRKANIRKTMFELYMMVALSLLLTLGWDDDESDSYNKYILARVRRELVTFISPSTAWDVIKSPTVVLNSIDGMSRIIYDLHNSIYAEIVDEEQPVYQHGSGKGYNKLWFDIMRQTGFNSVTQWDDLATKTRLVKEGRR